MTALVFDCDGVLADTERYGHLPAFNDTFAEFGLPVRWSEDAVYFQMDTKDLAPLVQPGQPLYGIEATTGGRLVVFGGGVLLRRSDGTIAGGVGVSAGTVDEDHQVAEAGRKGFSG